MFCNQCEQTSKGKACTRLGICGKNEAVAIQQDKLVWQLRELAAVALMARDAGIVDTATDDFAFKALFSTLTNVNFDPVSLRAVQEECLKRTTALAARVPGAPAPTPLAALDLRETAIDRLSDDEDVRSAMQILLYGLKGVAAYADHAAELGQRDPDVAAFLYRGLRAGTELDPESHDLNGWLGLVLECGKANLRAMELLEAGNTGTFGTPVPTPVSLGRRKGKAILISGHDLPDLLALLEQTRDTGINVYTHGEMLPAHAYPLLHAFPHLAGHYGTAWQNQQKELPAFPGAVLFTTNCIQDPKDYADKVFTSGNVSWPGLVHCKGRDFSAVIRKALELPGFAEDVPGKEVLTGFGRETLLGAAPAVLDAVAQGKLRHIFLVGGCDGARPGRNYYTEFVKQTPMDSLVLTLACGKYRFNDLDLGEIGGLPRILDMGQCNDAYSAIRVALALAEAFGCTVNDLPLTLVLSWYEQKAVCILLTLLSLGIKNMYLGPTLPAFLSETVVKTLVDAYGLQPITAPEQDMDAILHRG